MLESPSNKENWFNRYKELDDEYERIHGEIGKILNLDKLASVEDNKKLDELQERQIQISIEQGNLLRNKK
jgi:hypothetical protein